jgi:serine/threonine-protein kinase Chk1
VGGAEVCLTSLLRFVPFSFPSRLCYRRFDATVIAVAQLNDQGNYHAEPVDVWGAGIVLFTLICGSQSSSFFFFPSAHRGVYLLVDFPDCSDTPWDEPTSYSPEFAAYLTGELLTVPPWDRLAANALSELWRLSLATSAPN